MGVLGGWAVSYAEEEGYDVPSFAGFRGDPQVPFFFFFITLKPRVE